MARTIQVEPEQLNRAAGSIENLSNQYQSQYTTLYKEADAMGAQWKYKDNEAFITQIAGFKDDLKKMKDLMDAYASFLRQSAKAYHDAQDNITNQAKKLVN